MSYSSVLFALQNAGLSYRSAGEVFAYLASTATGTFTTYRDTLQLMGAAWAGGADQIADAVANNRGYAAILAALTRVGAAHDGAAELLAYELSTIVNPFVPPLGFTPAFWLNSDSVDGLSNAGLVDGQQVGTHVNTGSLTATWNVTQAVGANRPIFNAIGSPGKMNNRPAVAYNGSKSMSSATGLALQAQPITWFLVASANGVGTETYFGGVGANAEAILVSTLAISIFAGSAPATGQSITAGKIQTLSATLNGGSSTGSVDGVSSGAVAAGAQGLDNVIVGANGALLNNVTGLLYQLIAYVGAAPTPAQFMAAVTASYGATPQ